MAYFVSAIGSFIIVMKIFFYLLKKEKEKRDRSSWYYLLAFTGLGVYVMCSHLMISSESMLQNYTIWTAPLFLTFMVFYALLIPVFALFYKTCVLNKSPSNVIMYVVESHQATTYEEIRDWVDPKELILSRLEELVNHSYVSLEGDRFRLHPKGKRVIAMLALCRRLLKWKRGG